MSFLKSRFPFFILLFGFGCLYIHNLSVSVYGGDVGDLVTASFVGGVAHPPGYPLFVLLGYLLSHIPFFPSPAFGVGLISALSGAMGVGLFYLLQVRLTNNRFVSFLGSLALGFSFFYWFYSEIAEVFAFNAFFAILLFLLAISFRQTKQLKFFYALIFFACLSLCNQQTILFVFPSLALLVISPLWKLLRKQKRIVVYTVLSGLAGFLPYVYIPLAALRHPIVNWDNVHDIASFIRLIFRQDYGTLQAGIFSSPSFFQRIVSIKIYLGELITQLTIPVCCFSIIGLYVLFKKDTLIGIAVFLAWCISGPFFIAYAGFPLTSSFILGVAERFFLLSSVIMLIPFGVGILFFTQKLAAFLPKQRHYEHLFQALFLLIPILLLFYNFPKTNLSSVMIGDRYAEDLLTVLPPHAVLVISGDSLVFNTWYVHFVKGVRSDVTLYNIGGGVTSPFIEEKQQEQKKMHQADILANTLLDINRTRPVFSTVIIEPSKGDQITWVPFGLSYALVAPHESIPNRDLYLKKTRNIWGKMHLPTLSQLFQKSYHNLTITEFPTSYANALLATGTFFYSHYQDTQTAFSMYQHAKEIAPLNAKVYETLGALYLGTSGKCNDVVSNFSQAIGIDPFEQLPYFLLYNAYVSCAKNPTLAKEVKMEFEKIFQKDFSTEIKKSLTSDIEFSE